MNMVNRPKKPRSIGLYGKPNDFLNRIRVPGLDSSEMMDHQKQMDTMRQTLSDQLPKNKKRPMSTYGKAI